MISINLDLGEATSVLDALADRRNAALVAKAAAESFVDDTQDWIDAGRAFSPREGGLQQSINWLPLADGAEVYANADYAEFVEYGTGPFRGRDEWDISPKPGRKGLKIPVSGGDGYILRRTIRHKGSRPYPFFFADLDNRTAHMQERALSVLASRMANPQGGLNG